MLLILYVLTLSSRQNDVHYGGSVIRDKLKSMKSKRRNVLSNSVVSKAINNYLDGDAKKSAYYTIDNTQPQSVVKSSMSNSESNSDSSLSNPNNDNNSNISQDNDNNYGSSSNTANTRGTDDTSFSDKRTTSTEAIDTIVEEDDSSNDASNSDESSDSYTGNEQNFGSDEYGNSDSSDSSDTNDSSDNKSTEHDESDKEDDSSDSSNSAVNVTDYRSSSSIVQTGSHTNHVNINTINITKSVNDNKEDDKDDDETVREDEKVLQKEENISKKSSETLFKNIADINNFHEHDDVDDIDVSAEKNQNKLPIRWNNKYNNVSEVYPKDVLDYIFFILSCIVFLALLCVALKNCSSSSPKVDTVSESFLYKDSFLRKHNEPVVF